MYSRFQQRYWSSAAQEDGCHCLTYFTGHWLGIGGVGRFSIIVNLRGFALGDASMAIHETLFATARLMYRVTEDEGIAGLTRSQKCSGRAGLGCDRQRS